MMNRPQYPSSTVGFPVPGSNPNQQYFDTVSQQAAYQSGSGAVPNAPYNMQQQQIPAAGKIHAGYPGVPTVTSSVSGIQMGQTVIPAAPNIPTGAPLTFTPSGTTAASSPGYKNIKSTLTDLSEKYEAAMASQFRIDAMFLQNYLSGVDSNQKMESSELEEKPVVEPEIKPDAEIYALTNELAALDTFRQTANQAFWTSRHLPQTATSHFDATFELPMNLDNPTLNELQQTALEQINFVRKYRKAFIDCINGMAKNVEQPREEEYLEFLREEIYRQT